MASKEPTKGFMTDRLKMIFVLIMAMSRRLQKMIGVIFYKSKG